jgi:cytochrome c553
MSIRLCLILFLPAACAPEPAPGPGDPFGATGELIALSGGDAGPRYACHTCHGLEGEGNGAGAPRLSGLPQGYLVKQLQDYGDGRRRHPDMQKIARGLSMDARQRVSGWYAGRDIPQRPPLSLPAGETAAELWLSGAPGRGLPACASCHGRQGEGAGTRAPPIHDQPAPYLAAQLEAWRSGRRQNSPGHEMSRISQRVSGAEIEALARYAAQLPGAAPAAEETEP